MTLNSLMMKPADEYCNFFFKADFMRPNNRIPIPIHDPITQRVCFKVLKTPRTSTNKEGNNAFSLCI